VEDGTSRDWSYSAPGQECRERSGWGKVNVARKVAASKMVGRNELESAVLGITKRPRPDSSLFKSIFTNQSQTGLLRRHGALTAAIELNAKYDTRICTSA
jgi:hypothetical protein